MDTQTIELLGRNRVVDELLQAGIDVALPLRQSGINMLAYSRTKDGELKTCPIHLRASSGRKFSIEREHEVNGVIYVFVWGVGSENVATYALTAGEMERVAESTGYSLMQSSQKGLYEPGTSRSLLDEVERYRMTCEGWKKKLVAAD